MRLKKAIIPYLVLFESSQLLIFPISVGLRAVAESQVSSGGGGGSHHKNGHFRLCFCVIRAFSTDNRLKLAFQQIQGF